MKVYGEDAPRTVIATITTYVKDAGSYSYDSTAGNGKYTVELSNSNYVVGNAEPVSISQLPVILTWSEQLNFEYDADETREVAATVSNAIEGDNVTPIYRGETDGAGENGAKYASRATAVGSYISEVDGLSGGDSDNYTLADAQNLSEPWIIYRADEIVSLTAAAEALGGNIVYGGKLNLTATITTSPITQEQSEILVMASGEESGTGQGTVKFYANGNLIGTVWNVTPSDDGAVIVPITVDMVMTNYFSSGPILLKAEYSGDENWEPGEDYTTIIVEAKPITARITGDNTAKTYDGNDVAAGLDIKLEGVEPCDTDAVAAAADSCTYNSANVAEANTITANNATLSGTQCGNYVINNNAVTASGSIAPKTVKLEWRGVNGLVYTANPVNVNATALELMPGEVCLVEVENGSQINAGDYTAVAVNLYNSSYALPAPEDRTQDYTIDPEKLYIPERTVTYNGTRELTVEVSGLPAADDTFEQVAVTITTSSPDAGVYDYTDTQDGEAEGKYTASEDSNNYAVAGGAALTVEKAGPTYTAPTALNPVYNGQPQELVTGGSANGGEMQYSLSEYGPYSAAIPARTDADTYTVWYMVVGDKNHNDLGPWTLQATITPEDSDEPDEPDGPGHTSSGRPGAAPSGSSSSRAYPPVIEEPKKGSVDVTPTAPKQGDAVTIRPKPDPGYETGGVQVKDHDGNNLEITDNGDGSYSFIQRDSGVTVSVVFVCARDEYCPIWPCTDASPTAWYHDGVHYCIENGIMNGYGNYIFGPGNTLSRAMLAQILYNREGRPRVTGSSPFTDVPSGAWYTDAVVWAAANSVVAGYGNGEFGPDDPVTREQLGAMLYRYEKKQGGGFTGNWMFQLNFADTADLSAWAYEAMCWCNMNGIVVGKGNDILDPGGQATRAEAATMIMRFLELGR